MPTYVSKWKPLHRLWDYRYNNHTLFNGRVLYFVYRTKNEQLWYTAIFYIREGRGAMVRAWSFANVAPGRAGSNPAWCRIFYEKSCFSPLNGGTLCRCCVLGEGTLPSHASLDSGVNEYLVGQSWQCVLLVLNAEIAAVLYTLKSWNGVEMVHEWTGTVARGDVCEAHRALNVRLKVIYHPLYGMNNYVHIWGDWLSCDPLRRSHDSQSPKIWGW